MFISYCRSPIYHYRSSFPEQYFTEDYTNYSIRLLIFLIAGECLGFLAFIWAFRILCLSRGRISPIVIFLLLSDLLELLLNPLIVIIPRGACTCFNVLIGVRLCGHQLHQLLALESIITLKYPSLAHFFSPDCSIAICIAVWLIGIGCQFIPNVIIYLINIIFCVLPVTVCAVTCLLTCKESSDTNQPTERKPGVLVLSVAMFTLIILYVPFFLTIFTGLTLMLDCLASMRLISEPLLCVLIFREIYMVETVHTDTCNISEASF